MGCGAYIFRLWIIPISIGWILEQGMRFFLGTPFSFVCNHGMYIDGEWQRFYTGEGNPESVYHFETWFGNYEESFIAFILIVIMHFIHFGSKQKAK